MNRRKRSEINEMVENLNIEATKVGNTATITITKKDGTTESVEINDGVNGQDGQDGQDGYTPQKGILTEEDLQTIDEKYKEKEVPEEIPEEPLEENVESEEE